MVAERRWLLFDGLMQRYRFFFLLAAIVCLLCLDPFLRDFAPWATPFVSRVLMTAVFVLMLLLAVLAVQQKAWSNKLAISLAVPLVVLEVVQVVYDWKMATVAAHLLGGIFLVYVVVAITGYLLVVRQVTANLICASMCVYLLLGLTFALVYSTLESCNPNAFHVAEHLRGVSMEFGAEGSSDVLYFSFVTLTTLGFGDLTPRTPSAKMLVSMEAVTGQLFLAVLVARLVGLHIAGAREDRA